MSSPATIATLVTKVRQRADQINSATFDDVTELKPWVRASLRQLQEIISQQDNDWYTTSVPLSLSAGIEAYTMPANMKRLANVYALYNFGANRMKLTEFAYDDFGALNFPAYTAMPMQYRLMRNLLYVQPTPTQDVLNALEISYVPECQHPLLDYTPIDDMLPSGADEWIALDVLQKMAIKTRLQNMDDILKSKAELQTRLLRTLKNRSERAPVMRDGTRPQPRLPYVGYTAPQGPLVWVAA